MKYVEINQKQYFPYKSLLSSRIGSALNNQLFMLREGKSLHLGNIL